MKAFIQFENDIMQALLRKSDSKYIEQLKHQYANICVKSREFSGHGFFTHFYELDDKSLPLGEDINFELGGIIEAKMDSLKEGMGFVLFIRNGMIDMLEGFKYEDGLWWGDVDNYKIY